MTYTSYWDFDAFHKQKNSLSTAVERVNIHAGIIPREYRESEDKMGAIINYVFQGEKTTKDKNITRIGQMILKKEGRYDAKSKKYKPYINE